MTPEIQMIQKQLAALFEKYKGKILFAYCFGSLVKGNSSPLSDIDLAFYVKPENDLFDLKLALYTDCSRLLHRDDLGIIILNALKNLILADEIVTKGVLIYDSQPEQRINYEIRIHHQALDFKYQRKMLVGV